MMASAHNFLSNINSVQCPLSLLTFRDKRPVFLCSTKEKRRHAKRSKTENKKLKFLEKFPGGVPARMANDNPHK